MITSQGPSLPRVWMLCAGETEAHCDEVTVPRSEMHYQMTAGLSHPQGLTPEPTDLPSTLSFDPALRGARPQRSLSSWYWGKWVS